MGRNYLWHRQGDAINAVLAAVGYNFRLLIRWLRLLLFWLPGCLLQAASGRPSLKSVIFTDDFLPTIRPTQFNYPVDILGKWHGTKYRFIQRYRSGFPENLGEEFDAPFARLDWISRNRFDIQWHRHTGEWFCLHRGLTLAEAINTLRSEGLFHPL